MQQRYTRKQPQSSNPTYKHKRLDDATNASEFIVANADESKHPKFPHNHKPKKSRLIVVCLLLFVGIIAVIVISLHQRTLKQINYNHGSSLSSSSSLQQQQPDSQQQDPAFLQFLPIRPLPEWMTEYMTWHRQQLVTLDATNWKNKHHKYLIARCLDIDRVCGGVSDRLKSLPTLLLLARLSNRILFIHWNRPTRLEEFLIPTPFINWTLPAYIPVKGSGTRLYTKLTTLIKATTIQNSTVTILCARVQDQHGGSEFYNENHHLAQPQPSSSQHMSTTTNRAFRTVFRSVFFTFFQPSNRVSQSLTRIRQNFHAVVEPGMYHAVHFRAHYSKSMTSDQIAPWAINAVYCAHQNFNNNITTTPISQDGIDHPKIHHDRPILFLSDSNVAVQAVRDHFSTLSSSSTIRVLTVPRDMDPMHLDQPSSSSQADDDAAFVDLLLMAHARCVAHGQGGYGRFGALLSQNPMCFFKYFENAKWKMCQSTSLSSIFP